MSNLLNYINSVFSTYLTSDNKSHYNIPEYQRGYKWSSAEVKKMLNDINQFDPAGDKFYCLQNITIVPEENYYNVVDGQQRLTALTVLLSFLDQQELIREKIFYRVRENTCQFMAEFVETKKIFQCFSPSAQLQDCWSSFIKDYKHYNHQDIYYLFSTAHEISHYFEDKKDMIVLFTNKLLQSVKLIINRVADKNEEKIFGNLNSKRIPLDGADLVRAILITKVAREEGEKAGDIKNIVRVNERRVRIGWEIDEINNWWSKREVSVYFRRFISIDVKGDVEFNINKHPVNLLYLLYAEKEGHDVLSLDFIERHKSALELYKSIIHLHHLLKDWFEDQKIYHYLGFLFHQYTKKYRHFKEIVAAWEAHAEREQFKQYLKKKIKQLIFEGDEIADVFKETNNWYEDNQDKLVKILLLLDIIENIKDNRAFLPAQAFTKVGNDIEHIFPQNPQETEDKKRYIEFLIKYARVKDIGILDEYDSNHGKPEYQARLEDFIKNSISDIRINSIGNLVLLYYSLNRSLQNAPYAVKRAKIIAHFNNGNFIQPHTFKVIARYFVTADNDSLDLEHWTNEDIEQNETAIKDTLTTFFN